jgi:hypothetical protein
MLQSVVTDLGVSGREHSGLVGHIWIRVKRHTKIKTAQILIVCTFCLCIFLSVLFVACTNTKLCFWFKKYFSYFDFNSLISNNQLKLVGKIDLCINDLWLCTKTNSWLKTKIFYWG